MEIVITLSRLSLYILLLHCLQHTMCLPYNMDKTEIVTDALIRRTVAAVESELATTTVTAPASLKLQRSEHNKQIESNKEKPKGVTVEEDNKRVVSSTTPIDNISDLWMGTEPRIRHSTWARSVASRKKSTKCKQIYSIWKIFLSIDKDGRVYGTDSNDDNTIFEITKGPSLTPTVLLKGKTSQLYLCINSTGDMYGNRIPLTECYLQEKRHKNDGWTSFSSCKYPSNSTLCRGRYNKRKAWMVALNKDGSPNSAETAWHTKKKSTRFLKIDVPIQRSTSR